MLRLKDGKQTARTCNPALYSIWNPMESHYIGCYGFCTSCVVQPYHFMVLQICLSATTRHYPTSHCELCALDGTIISARLMSYACYSSKFQSNSFSWFVGKMLHVLQFVFSPDWCARLMPQKFLYILETEPTDSNRVARVLWQFRETGWSCQNSAKCRAMVTSHKSLDSWSDVTGSANVNWILLFVSRARCFFVNIGSAPSRPTIQLTRCAKNFLGFAPSSPSSSKRTFHGKLQESSSPLYSRTSVITSPSSPWRSIPSLALGTWYTVIDLVTRTLAPGWTTPLSLADIQTRVSRLLCPFENGFTRHGWRQREALAVQVDVSIVGVKVGSAGSLALAESRDAVTEC